jgi:predicted MFS family arabinose efflux permease
VLLDAAVQVNQVVSQRIIYAVPSKTRGRVNALYMTLLFAGGALGSVLGTITYEKGGWEATAMTGGVIGLLMLTLFSVEKLRARTRGARG